MSLALCSSGHEEVCFESRKCPACEVSDELEAKIKELRKELDELADQI
jgi:hypothetical protein